MVRPLQAVVLRLVTAHVGVASGASLLEERGSSDTFAAGFTSAFHRLLAGTGASSPSTTLPVLWKVSSIGLPVRAAAPSSNDTTVASLDRQFVRARPRPLTLPSLPLPTGLPTIPAPPPLPGLGGITWGPLYFEAGGAKYSVGADCGGCKSVATCNSWVEVSNSYMDALPSAGNFSCDMLPRVSSSSVAVAAYEGDGNAGRTFGDLLLLSLCFLSAVSVGIVLWCIIDRWKGKHDLHVVSCVEDGESLEGASGSDDASDYGNVARSKVLSTVGSTTGSFDGSTSLTFSSLGSGGSLLRAAIQKRTRSTSPSQSSRLLHAELKAALVAEDHREVKGDAPQYPHARSEIPSNTPASSTLAPGAPILAIWGADGGEYDAVVESINDNGTVTVCWCDGARSHRDVPASHVRRKEAIGKYDNGSTEHGTGSLLEGGLVDIAPGGGLSKPGLLESGLVPSWDGHAPGSLSASGGCVRIPSRPDSGSSDVLLSSATYGYAAPPYHHSAGPMGGCSPPVSPHHAHAAAAWPALQQSASNQDPTGFKPDR